MAQTDQLANGTRLIARWAIAARQWWEQNWLRFHAVMTPIGSGLVTLWLSRGEHVGWLWNSQAEFGVAAKFASAGILFYTGSFAILESGVWLLMVLALKALESYEIRKERRRQDWLLDFLQSVKEGVPEDVFDQIMTTATGNLSEESRRQFMERWREAQRS